MELLEPLAEEQTIPVEKKINTAQQPVEKTTEEETIPVSIMLVCFQVSHRH